ncbi:phosphoribosylaminoimidazolesuccinocarboxamide synthase [Halarsenatibacter silvermanii]|uniref:Phosphoribosylaminoimidazole-succinocarboxamide synthase n=1 Tax=Halarsenatibacter silvermanii TaxID=321763 RepID=A0A1G9PUH1_9FIRM|nr:phosphoribosylaminoimidazolesuccinocarboxamide synthase [Halarsenatibacter silvermanii]SDM02404.1 phosphoribosylaminoimidazole-succinocarboxamide synthase [Halarsenatibacter silvermanii]
MQKKDMLYEGKAKKLYTTEDKQKMIMEFKDDATAFDGEKKASLQKKGKLNTEISMIFFELLEAENISTHYLEKLSDNEMLVEKMDIFPLEVVVRNIVAGSLAERTGLAEGTELEEEVIEFFYKSDELGDPLLNSEHIKLLELADKEELAEIRSKAREINNVLQQFLAEAGIDLVDFKLEFGRTDQEEIKLADEITPDTCRLWDVSTGKKLDKDRFRQEMGGVMAGYEEILKRIKKEK